MSIVGLTDGMATLPTVLNVNLLGPLFPPSARLVPGKISKGMALPAPTDRKLGYAVWRRAGAELGACQGNPGFPSVTQFFAELLRVLGLGALACALCGTSALAAGGPDPPKSAVPVLAARANQEDVPIFLSGLGTVRAFNSVVLTSRVDGQILKIGFSEGQEVHAGDVLVEIDPRPFQAALAQAQSAKLKDEAMLANAHLDMGRAQKLVGTGAGTTQQLDTARSQVAQLEASTKADQAAVDAAQVQLDYCWIRSPIDGRTGTRLVDAGNIVRAASAIGIVTINQVRPISVEFDLPADDLPQVRSHMRADAIPAMARDRNDRQLAMGRLAMIDNQVNVSTGTIRLKATFDNADERLWPGQFVTVRLQVDVREGAVTVPVSAVLRGPDGTYAFVINPLEVIEKRPISVEFTDNAVAIIGSGLKPGERVVTEGQYRIQAGSAVTIPSEMAAERGKPR